MVQRGLLGVMIRSVDGNLAKDKDLDVVQGVYVDSLLENSAAASAGIKSGDIILSVNGTEVNSSPELQEQIARLSPGDKVKIKVDRKGNEKDFMVTLNNRNGNPERVTKDESNVLSLLGAEFESLSPEAAKKLDIPGGVKVKTIGLGKLRRSTQMQEGFIITKVDGQPVWSKEELEEVLSHKKGGVLLEGIYEDIPGVSYYAFGLDS